MLWGKLMKKLDKSELEWISTTMRRIWLRSNEFILNSPSRVVQLVRENLEEFQATQNSLKTQTKSQTTRINEDLWRKPDKSYVKANFDAALD